MDELIAQLQRLYLPDTPAPALSAMLTGEGQTNVDLVGPGGQVRALVIELDNDFWAQAAQLYEGVQTELDLPAPAVSVASAALQSPRPADRCFRSASRAASAPSPADRCSCRRSPTRQASSGRPS